MSRTRRGAPRRVASVERAIDVLDELAAAGGELGVNELARRTGVNASTVSRLLATMVARRLVEQVPESGQYRLGPRLAELGELALARIDLRGAARPHLEKLSAETGETATLSVPADPDPVTVDFVLSAASVQSVARVGRPSILHATATGKVQLAFGERPLPQRPLAAFTPRTITDPERLAHEVERVRERGFARALGEREEELNALAAPVCGAHGKLVAIMGVQGPASRFTKERMAAAVPLLLAHAAAVSRTLGAPGLEQVS